MRRPMAAPAIAVRTRVEPLPASPWIIGPTSDLAWLIGGAVLSYAMLAAHVVLGVPAVMLYMAWVLAIDGPHVFATISRTYLDREERAERARLLRWSLGFFALGPACVGVAAALGSRVPFDVFIAFCSLWAYWHVVRQHYGVLALYERKAREPRGLDGVALQVALIAPFVAFLVAHPRTLALFGATAPPAWAIAVSHAAWWTFAGAVATLVGRPVVAARAGRGLYPAKLLFLAAAVSVSAVLFSPPVARRIQYEAVSPIVTSFHNVQYLAIVWFFHANRARAGRTAAPLAVRSVWAFLGAGVAFTVLYRVLLGCVFSTWPGCDIGAEQMPLTAGLSVSDLGVSFLWGFALHHYYLDQRIWHVRRDVAVSRDLRLA